MLHASSEHNLQHALDLFAAACCKVAMKISTPKRQTHYVSLEIKVTVRRMEMARCCCRSKPSSNLVGIHEWRKAEQGDWQTDW